MSLVQIILCVKCGYREQIPYSEPLKMPWEVWVNGCPRCKGTKVDVYVIFDKLGRLDGKNIHIRKLIGEMRE